MMLGLSRLLGMLFEKREKGGGGLSLTVIGARTDVWMKDFWDLNK